MVHIINKYIEENRFYVEIFQSSGEQTAIMPVQKEKYEKYKIEDIVQPQEFGLVTWGKTFIIPKCCSCNKNIPRGDYELFVGHFDFVPEQKQFNGMSHVGRCCLTTNGLTWCNECGTIYKKEEYHSCEYVE